MALGRNAIGFCRSLVECCLSGFTVFALVSSYFPLPWVRLKRLMLIEEHWPSPSLFGAHIFTVLAFRGTQSTPEVSREIAEYLKFLTLASPDRLSLWVSAC